MFTDTHFTTRMVSTRCFRPGACSFVSKVEDANGRSNCVQMALYERRLRIERQLESSVAVKATYPSFFIVVSVLTGIRVPTRRIWETVCSGKIFFMYLSCNTYMPAAVRLRFHLRKKSKRSSFFAWNERVSSFMFYSMSSHESDAIAMSSTTICIIFNLCRVYIMYICFSNAAFLKPEEINFECSRLPHIFPASGIP